MNYLQLSLKDIWRYKTRNVFSLVGIALSIALFFSILSVHKGFKQGLNKQRQVMGIDFVVAPGSCPHEMASLLFHGAVPVNFLDESLVIEVRKTAGLTFASPMIILNIPSPGNKEKVLLYGYEMPLLEKIKPGWKIRGEIPIGWDAIAANRVLVGSDFAEKHQLKVGDVIDFLKLDRTLLVSGIIERTYSKDDAFIYAPLMIAQDIAVKVSGREVVEVKELACSSVYKMTASPISAIAVKTEDPGLITEISHELEKRVPGIQIVTVSQATESAANLVASTNLLAIVVCVIAFIVAVAGVMNAILMTVFELTAELGMMRAVGASRGDIFKLIVAHAVLLTFLGGLSGLALIMSGAGGIRWLISRIIPYYHSSEVIAFDINLAAWCLLVSILLGAAAGLFPAWRASRVNPIEAIRSR